MTILSESVINFIKECMQKPHSQSYLIDVLHKIQDEKGYLSKESLAEVSSLMQIPSAKVSGVASFYHFFRLKKQGRFIISVCTGTACHVKGAQKIINKIKEELGIDFGETTKDGLFTLEEARCLGMCALAPVIKIGDDIHPQVTVDKVPSILESYFNAKP